MMTSPTYFRAFTLLAVVAAALMAAVITAGTASAQASTGNTITVNSTTDNPAAVGSCSLRKAIQAANTNAAVDTCPAGSATGPDTILFASGLTGEILLTSQLPSITDPKGLTIDGRTNAIVVSGNTTARILYVNGAPLTLKNLTLVDGNAFFGAGVTNVVGTLVVFNSTFSGNKSGNASGGAIWNNGSLRITNSTFSGNSSGGGAGGIFNLGSQAVASVTNSTFSGNSATNDTGGGILNVFGAHLSVTNSTFSANKATKGGGGLSNGVDSPLFLTNNTFSGNSAGPNSGGGISNFGSAATVKLLNTIVANSPSGGNCRGTVTDSGFNISSDRSCRLIQPTSKSNTNPKLAASLANNGGPTQTIALLKGSPALNAIPKGKSRCAPAPNPLTTDQRGVKRPQGTACDIGAYEKVVVRR